MMNDFTISREEAMKHLQSGTEKLLAKHGEDKHSPEYESGWFNAFFGVQDIIHEILNEQAPEHSPTPKPKIKGVVVLVRGKPIYQPIETVNKSAAKPTGNAINHPDYYNTGKIEVIDFLEDQNLPFHLGNAVKYICRAGKKDPHKTVEDLKKAAWYINRYIHLVLDTPDPEVSRHD